MPFVVNFTHSKLGTSNRGHVEQKIMKIVLKEYTASFAPMSNRFWSGIWIAVISKTALPGSSAKTAAMNIYWFFPVNDAIFARPVIKRGWSNSGNGFVKKLSRPFPIDISSSVSLKSCGDIISMIEGSLLGVKQTLKDFFPPPQKRAF